jgi:hypothetical protein
VRIDIDRNKFNKIDFNHPLINHTFDFKKKNKKDENTEKVYGMENQLQGRTNRRN